MFEYCEFVVGFLYNSIKLFFSVEDTFCWMQFFLLNLLCLHLTFIYVDFASFFHLPCCSVFGCQKNKGLSTVCSKCIFSKFIIAYCGFFCLLFRDTVILFTKLVHSFSCQNEKLKPTSPNSAPPQSPVNYSEGFDWLYKQQYCWASWRADLSLVYEVI